VIGSAAISSCMLLGTGYKHTFLLLFLHKWEVVIKDVFILHYICSQTFVLLFKIIEKVFFSFKHLVYYVGEHFTICIELEIQLYFYFIENYT